MSLRAEVSGSHQGRGGEGLGRHSSPYTCTRARLNVNVRHRIHAANARNKHSKQTQRSKRAGKSPHLSRAPPKSRPGQMKPKTSRGTPQSRGRQLSNLMGRRAGKPPRRDSVHARLHFTSSSTLSTPPQTLSESCSEAQGRDDADSLGRCSSGGGAAKEKTVMFGALLLKKGA